jgi:hemoglobin
MRGQAQSIYDRIGGEGALVDVVDDAYERLRADPRLHAFCAGVPTARLVDRSGVLPGERHTRSDLPMRDVHHRVEQGDLTLVTAHLDDALHAAGVPEPTVEEIISVVAPLAPEIVSQPLTS